MPDPAQILRDAYDQVRRDYGGAIGRRREELVTPALVLDIDVAQRNIDHMASELKQMGAAVIRPHYKAHKNPDIARRQVAAGAAGLSMATVWEAVVLAAAGFDDLFVVNTVGHPGKLRALAELARDHRILVAVDEAANAEALSCAEHGAGGSRDLRPRRVHGGRQPGGLRAGCRGARPAGAPHPPGGRAGTRPGRTVPPGAARPGAARAALGGRRARRRDGRRRARM